MLCPKCGVDAKDAKFCPECGEKIIGTVSGEDIKPSSAEDVKAVDNAQVEAYYQAVKRIDEEKAIVARKKKKKRLIVFASILGIIGIMISVNAVSKYIKSKCEQCDGSGKVQCGECDGDGKLSCYDCSGRGMICLECDDGKAKCESCNGSGFSGSEMGYCYKCNGTGRLYPEGNDFAAITLRRLRGELNGGSYCSYCQGTGKKSERITCTDCKGTGNNGKACPHCGGTQDADACGLCHGSGYEKCYECSGSGFKECHTCHGKGRIKNR